MHDYTFFFIGFIAFFIGFPLKIRARVLFLEGQVVFSTLWEALVAVLVSSYFIFVLS